VGRPGCGAAPYRQPLGEQPLSDLLHRGRVDFSLGWRLLADAADPDSAQAPDGERRFRERLGVVHGLPHWLTEWHDRLRRNVFDDRHGAELIRSASPVYIPLNNQVERTLFAAVEDGDLTPFDRLLAVLADPFTERADDAAYAEPAPSEVTATYETFCGT
jgi:uncharacterized protein YdiU (UPF0061 family)